MALIAISAVLATKGAVTFGQLALLLIIPGALGFAFGLFLDWRSARKTNDQSC